MTQGIARSLSIGLLALGLAACGTSAPPPEPGPGASQPTQGYYKVGRPYRINGVWYTPAVDYAYDETGVASWYGPGFHGRQTANGETYDQYDLTAAHPTLPMPSLVRVTNLENGRVLDLRINDRGPFARGRILDVSKRGAELLGFLGQGTAKVRVQVLARESKQLAAMARQGRIAQGPGGSGAEVSEVTAAPVETVSASELTPAVVAQPQSRPPRSSDAPVLAAQPSGTVGQVPVRDTTLFVQTGAFSSRDNAVRMAERISAFGEPSISQVQVDGQPYWRVRLGPLTDVAAADRTLASLIDGGFPQSRVVVD